MGLFGPSKDEQAKAIYELSVLLYSELALAVDDQLVSRGLDPSSNPPLHNRVRSAAARHSNELQGSIRFNDAKRFASHPEDWKQMVAHRADQVMTEVMADVAARPLVPADAKGAARYGPNHGAVIEYLDRVRQISSDRWTEICIGTYATMTRPEAVRFRQFRAQATSAKARIAVAQNLHDEMAWAQWDAQEAGAEVRKRCDEIVAGRFPPGLATYVRVADSAQNDLELAAGTIVIRDHLPPEQQAILMSTFGTEIMGQEQWEQSEREFAEAQMQLRLRSKT